MVLCCCVRGSCVVELDLHGPSMTLTLGCPPALLVKSVLPQCGPKRLPHLRQPTIAADHHFHGRGMVRAAMAGLVGFLPSGFLYVEPGGTVAELVMGEPQVVAAKASSVEGILARQLARRFREMSDEELAEVLEQLLRASKSFTVLSKDGSVPGLESLEQEKIKLGAGIEQRSSNRSGKIDFGTQGTEQAGVSEKNGGEGLRSESQAATSSEGKADQVENISAGKEKVESSAEAKEATQPGLPQDTDSRAQDSANSGRAEDVKDIVDEDLTVLLWKEFQKRVDSASEAKDLANAGAKDLSLSRDPQDLIRDPKVVATGVGVLILNAVLIFGQWKFLDWSQRKKAAIADKNMVKMGVKSELSKTSERSSMALDQKPGLFGTIWTNMGEIFNQMRDIGKNTDNVEGNPLGENRILGEGSRNKEDRPFSERLASIRKAATERQSQVLNVADAPLIPQKRVGRVLEPYKEEFLVKAAEQSIKLPDSKVVRGRVGEIEVTPSSSNGNREKGSDDGSGGNGRDRLVRKSNSPAEQDGEEVYVPAHTDYGKNLRVRDEADATTSSRSPLKSLAGNRLAGVSQRPGIDNKDFRMSRTHPLRQMREVDIIKKNKQTMWVNRDADQRDELSTSGIKEGYRKYGELKLVDESVEAGKRDTSRFKCKEVDYWANPGGWSNVSSKPVNGVEIFEEIYTDPGEDQFSHNGVLWMRDVDGVFVKHLPNSNVSLSSQIVGSAWKPMNEQQSSMKLENLGLTSTQEDGHTPTGARWRTKSRVPLQKGRQNLNKPAYNYRHLVLQHETNDIPLEKFGPSQRKPTASMQPPVQAEEALQGEQKLSSFNEVTK